MMCMILFIIRINIYIYICAKHFKLSILLFDMSGNCEEDPRIRGIRQQQQSEYLNTVARGAAVGSMIGSVFPAIGNLLGSIIGGLFSID